METSGQHICETCEVQHRNIDAEVARALADEWTDGLQKLTLGEARQGYDIFRAHLTEHRWVSFKAELGHERCIHCASDDDVENGTCDSCFQRSLEDHYV